FDGRASLRPEKSAAYRAGPVTKAETAGSPPPGRGGGLGGTTPQGVLETLLGIAADPVDLGLGATNLVLEVRAQARLHRAYQAIALVPGQHRVDAFLCIHQVDLFTVVELAGRTMLAQQRRDLVEIGVDRQAFIPAHAAVLALRPNLLAHFGSLFGKGL